MKIQDIHILLLPKKEIYFIPKHSSTKTANVT